MNLKKIISSLKWSSENSIINDFSIKPRFLYVLSIRVPKMLVHSFCSTFDYSSQHISFILNGAAKCIVELHPAKAWIRLRSGRLLKYSSAALDAIRNPFFFELQFHSIMIR